jgi:hypothetical protein
MRRFLPIVLVLPLTACGVSWTVPVGAFAGANLASIMALHRTLFDVIWSFAANRDCSIVWLDKGLSYCKPIESEPPPLPYCTRTLGWVDCWTDPQVFIDPPRQVADGPYQLTPAQEKNRTRGWP